MFIADEYSEQAFVELKKLGIIPATPENLFGLEVAKALILLGDLICYLARNYAGSFEQIDEIMAILSRIQGASSQLQGDLFEYIVAEVYRPTNSCIELGALCQSDDGKKADCDVLAIAGKSKITFIECKGYSPYSPVLHDVVKHWISHQVPVFYNYACRMYPNAEIHMEFWTTGKLSDESNESLQKFIENSRKRNRYKITIREAHDVREAVRATKDRTLKRVFEKHFIGNSKPQVPRIKRGHGPSRLAGGDIISDSGL